MKKTSVLILGMVCGTMLCFAESPSKSEATKPKEGMAACYSKITLSDGVDEKEANELVRMYFQQCISGCGNAGDVIDAGKYWESKTLVGRGAQPGDSIFVQKDTGTVTCTSGPTIDPMAKPFEEVVVSDGINEIEANLLANSYFQLFFPGCGNAEEVSDTGKTWESKTRVGIDGAPSDSIFIEKETGKMTCAKRPTIEPPKEKERMAR